jgi:hypothetical protein
MNSYEVTAEYGVNDICEDEQDNLIVLTLLNPDTEIFKESYITFGSIDMMLWFRIIV